MLRTLLLLLAVVLLFLANVAWGTVSLSLREVWEVLMGEGDGVARFVVMESRLPAALTATLAGASLSIGGLLMQTLFRNPLADPSILGISSGAGLGAAIVLLAFSGIGLLATASAAMVGAIVAISLLVATSAWVRSSTSLLVVGVMLSSIIGSLTSLLNFFATDEGVKSFVIWGLGNFNGCQGERLGVYAACCVLSLLLLPLTFRSLDALLLGDDYALSVGINVRRHRTLLLLLVGWLTAVTTAVCGPVAFIGLAVPHAARRLTRSALHRRLALAPLLLGSGTALACLFISRLPVILGLSHSILPLGCITPLIGAPVVIAILMLHRP